MTSAYWDQSYPPEIYDEPTPAAGAAAGTPGTWTPEGAQVPGSLPELQAADQPVVADPTTAWPEGSYVELGDGTQAHWDGTTWAAGPALAPAAPAGFAAMATTTKKSSTRRRK